MKLELSDKQAAMLCRFLDQTIPGGLITKANRQDQIVYDIFCVLRKAVAEKENSPMSDTWRNPPLHLCRTEPLARVEP